MIIPYLGEKSKFSNFIIPNLPTDISKYIEPFGGMYGIFFNLDLSKYRNCKFIYNDINWLNYNLFRHLSHDEFIYNIKNLIVDKNFFDKIKHNIFVENNFSELESAIYYSIILNCTDDLYDLKNSNFKNDYMTIFYHRLINNVKYINHIDEITNFDYIEIIKKHDSESSFFYIDPPYYGREHYYLNHNFTKERHEELAEVLSKIKGRFALSYYNFDKLDDFYKNCKIINNKTLMGTEYLIMNYA